MSEEMKNIVANAVQFVTDFFICLDNAKRTSLAPVLKSPGTWMAIYDKTIIGIFFLNKSSMKRVVENLNKGWQGFPGFLIAEDQRQPNSPVAIKVDGSCNLFSSNRTSNMFAFCVSPGASFTVVDHFHEIKDSSGQEFRYHVDVAFVLGIKQGEDWPGVQSRLSELLNHTISVWQKIT